jgi:hypothetical protein
MMHFDRPVEPAGFHERVRVPGENWLSNHRSAKPELFPDYWKRFRHELGDGFTWLCAYSAVRTVDGEVDHYRSKSKCPELAYEWSNYRYASSRINSRKSTHDQAILDPFEVQDDWFEVQLGTWQLLITDNLPPDQRMRAEFTLEKLGLGSGDDAVRTRRIYYDEFAKGGSTLQSLDKSVPLVARAVRSFLEKLTPVPDEHDSYREFLNGEITITKLERDAPRIASIVRTELPPCSARSSR